MRERSGQTPAVEQVPHPIRVQPVPHRQRLRLVHLRVVTGLTAVQALSHVDAAFALWEQRSARTWTLDLIKFTGAGITLAPAVQRIPASCRG